MINDNKIIYNEYLKVCETTRLQFNNKMNELELLFHKALIEEDEFSSYKLKTINEEKEIFYFKTKKNLSRIILLQENRCVMLKNSIIYPNKTNFENISESSLGQYVTIKNLRDAELEKENIKLNEDGFYTVVNNIEFNSPSQAGAFTIAAPCNGKISYISLKTNKTIAETFNEE